MSKARRKKNEETKRRFEAIKDLMSTFAMSTVAVVAAVTLIPASPKAEVIKAVALTDEIAYQVIVTDEENALDLDTLYVVLENQLESYEQPISLGENSGYFDSLETDTEYRLSVYGDKGFGKERLDTLMITTKEKVGGTILAVTPEVFDFSTTYFVDVSVNDPDSKYTSVNLYYGVNSGHDDEFIYYSIPVPTSRMSIEIQNIHSSEAFHIYLEGTTLEDTELLDEIWVTPTFELHISLYTEYFTNESVGFFMYDDMSTSNISYEMNIYKGESLFRTDQISLTAGDFHGAGFEIDNLSPNTTYLFECIAIFTNPQTLRQEEQIIYQEEQTTLENYSYSYSLEEFDEYIEVSIILDDPSNYFQNAYYESYDTSGEQDLYLTSETYMFIELDNEKTVTLTILIPTSTSYRITIGIRNQDDFSIRQNIDIIIYE